MTPSMHTWKWLTTTLSTQVKFGKLSIQMAALNSLSGTIGNRVTIQNILFVKVCIMNSTKLWSTSISTTLLELAGVPKDQTPPDHSMDSPKLTITSNHTRNSLLLQTILLGDSKVNRRN